MKIYSKKTYLEKEIKVKELESFLILLDYKKIKSNNEKKSYITYSKGNGYHEIYLPKEEGNKEFVFMLVNDAIVTIKDNLYIEHSQLKGKDFWVNQEDLLFDILVFLLKNIEYVIKADFSSYELEQLFYSLYNIHYLNIPISLDYFILNISTKTNRDKILKIRDLDDTDLVRKTLKVKHINSNLSLSKDLFYLIKEYFTNNNKSKGHGSDAELILYREELINILSGFVLVHNLYTLY